MTFPRGLDLVLVGKPIIPIPTHHRIHHLGYLSDEDKFDALAAADLLIMPSYFESLSMVALEAWALGRPVLANGRCDVLKGQCIRSNAGLYYESYEEFAETLYSLESNGPLHARLGKNGRDYFVRHYAWPVIEKKYLDMFRQLDRGPAGAPRPSRCPAGLHAAGATLPPATEVLSRLPSGAVLPESRAPGGTEPHDRPPARPSGARHAGLRRRDRPRGPRRAARAAKRRV